MSGRKKFYLPTPTKEEQAKPLYKAFKSNLVDHWSIGIENICNSTSTPIQNVSSASSSSSTGSNNNNEKGFYLMNDQNQNAIVNVNKEQQTSVVADPAPVGPCAGDFGGGGFYSMPPMAPIVIQIQCPYHTLMSSTGDNNPACSHSDANNIPQFSKEQPTEKDEMEICKKKKHQITSCLFGCLAFDNDSNNNNDPIPKVTINKTNISWGVVDLGDMKINSFEIINRSSFAIKLNLSIGNSSDKDKYFQFCQNNGEQIGFAISSILDSNKQQKFSLSFKPKDHLFYNGEISIRIKIVNSECSGRKFKSNIPLTGIGGKGKRL